MSTIVDRDKRKSPYYRGSFRGRRVASSKSRGGIDSFEGLGGSERVRGFERLKSLRRLHVCQPGKEAA
jgi:hypothetical protein